MSLDEVNRYQSSLITSIQQENSNLEEALKTIDLDAMINKACVYYNKLLAIKKEMESLNERSEKLKKRALKLQEEKQREALEYELEREKEYQLEKHLQPVVPFLDEDSSS